MTLAELRKEHGSVTAPLFDQHAAGLVCKYCGKGPNIVGAPALVRGTGTDQEERRVTCRHCDRFQEWLSKTENKVGRGPRPKLRTGTIGDVWEAFGNRCLHCGCEAHFLAAIGVERTVQHVPPFSVVGHEAWLFPYCSWCNQDAAGRWQRWDAVARRLQLVDYFRAGMDEPDETESA
jgi:hypothetical protein